MRHSHLICLLLFPILGTVLFAEPGASPHGTGTTIESGAGVSTRPPAVEAEGDDDGFPGSYDLLELARLKSYVHVPGWSPLSNTEEVEAAKQDAARNELRAATALKALGEMDERQRYALGLNAFVPVLEAIRSAAKNTLVPAPLKDFPASAAELEAWKTQSSFILTVVEATLSSHKAALASGSSEAIATTEALQTGEQVARAQLTSVESSLKANPRRSAQLGESLLKSLQPASTRLPLGAEGESPTERK